MNVRSVLGGAAAELSAAGVPSPRTDAELLAARALGVPRGKLLLVDVFTQDQLDEFRQLIAERVKRIPLQHLLGRAPFGDLDIAVGPGVFIPRPETELLVDWALRRTAEDALVMDLCSGSGAIALAIAHQRPRARVIAIENDGDALVWLRRNAHERSAAGDLAIEVIKGDVTDPDVPPRVFDGTVDVLLCNPPYVPELSSVPDEVFHDPRPAVFGGPTGLDVIGPVIRRACTLVAVGGIVAIEHDDSHGVAVAALFAAAGAFIDIEVNPDLAGRPRFTTARRWHTGSL